MLSSRSESGAGCRAWSARTVVFLPSGVWCVGGGEGDGVFPERERASLLPNVVSPASWATVIFSVEARLTGLAWTDSYARSLAVQSCRFRAQHAKPRCRSPINLLPAQPASADWPPYDRQTHYCGGRRRRPQRPRKVYHVVHQSHNRYK